jgi:outer membrane murein-binding lipoprotein Lpp
MLHLIEQGLTQYGGLLQTLGSLVLLVFGAVGIVRIRAIGRWIWSRERLVSTIQALELRNEEIKSDLNRASASLEVSIHANEAWQSSSEQWQAAVTEMTAEIHELRGEVTAARDESRAAREEIAQLRGRLKTYAQYTTTLILYIRRGDNKETPPQIPEELRGDFTNLPTF